MKTQQTPDCVRKAMIKATGIDPLRKDKKIDMATAVRNCERIKRETDRHVKKFLKGEGGPRGLCG